MRAAGNPKPDLTARRLGRLAAMTPISATDIRILECLLLYETNRPVEKLVDDNFSDMQHRRQCNAGYSALSFLLDLSLARRLIRLATVPGKKPDVKDLLLGKPGPAELEWSDFDHLAADRDHVETLLRGTLRAGEPGVNILFHGPPGTGKTQLGKALAGKLGMPLFDVAREDCRGGEPDRSERLGDLTLAHALLAADRNSLVLFDEMVDLLPDNNLSFLFGGSRRGTVSGGSKLFMNRLQENAPVPTLWTRRSNSPGASTSATSRAAPSACSRRSRST